jgi:acrylyl-CoA reductase (NADPH)
LVAQGGTNYSGRIGPFRLVEQQDMTDQKFQALVIRDADGKPRAGFEDLTLADLPDNDVLVEISHSSLNYKDGLAISGRGRIARRLPMVGGVDLAGTVVASKVPEWTTGDRVVVNGWGLSETEWGGYSRFQSIMAIGTAGYTAALCVLALEDWGVISPDDGEVLVTGAAGGVGTVAIALLARRGYNVTASTGRESEHDFLRGLGARSIIARDELSAPGKMLQAERWSGAVDAAVAACGLAQGADLPASVMPHILRGVALLGIDSVMAPQDKRARAWDYLDRHLDRETLKSLTTTAKLGDVPELANTILDGRTRGRYVIEIA